MFAYLNTSVITKIAELKPKEIKVYQYLVTNCNKHKDYKYTDKRGQIHALQQGQMVTTGRSIASVIGSNHHETGMDILRSLERKKMIQLYITKRVTGFRSKGFTIVTVTDIKDAPYNPVRANEVMREKYTQNTPILHALNNSNIKRKDAEPKTSAIPTSDIADNENSNSPAMCGGIVGNISSSIGPCLEAGPNVVVGGNDKSHVSSNHIASRKLLTEIYSSVSCSESDYNYCGNVVRAFKAIINPTIAEKDMYKYASDMQKQIMECY